MRKFKKIHNVISIDLDYYKESKNICLNKETLEFRINKLLKGKHIGAGNNSIDIVFNNLLIDIKKY